MGRHLRRGTLNSIASTFNRIVSTLNSIISTVNSILSTLNYRCSFASDEWDGISGGTLWRLRSAIPRYGTALCGRLWPATDLYRAAYATTAYC